MRIFNSVNKNRLMFFSIICICFVFLFLGLNVIFMKRSSAVSLTNISELSETFMDDYFEQLSSIDADDENVLIVTSLQDIDEKYGATKVIEAPNHQYILQFDSKDAKDEALSELKKDSSILSAEENDFFTIDTTTYNSWGVEAMDLDYAIDNSDASKLETVTVAIIDTGCDMDLFNKYYAGKIVETYNVLKESTEVMSDTNGHGTHIAGTIAEATPDNVKILPVKVSNTGTMSTSSIIAAINYIVYYEKADVISMSFGSYSNNVALEQAIESAKEKNIISVASAGNSNKNSDHYPSGFDNTIAIASIDSNLKKSTFSNYGSAITFTAPGTDIKSIMGKDASISKNNGNNEDDDHETISGTSMATPHAASAVAILKSYNKDLTFDNVIELLKMKAIDLGDEGWDEYYGHGLISFNGATFCDNIHCDEYGVYKDFNKNIESVELADLKLTEYNYYSLINLMGIKVKVNYIDGTSEEMLLADFADLEVLNYDPNVSDEQTVTIEINGISLDIKVDHPDNYESGWETREISSDNTKVELIGYKDHGLNIGKLYVPETIDSKMVVAFADDVEFSKKSDFNSYQYLYLPSSFKRIGNSTLLGSKIKYIYGDSSGVEIGAHALESSDLVKVEIPLIKVENSAFKDCFELIYVDVVGEFKYTYGSGIEVAYIDIEEYAFYNCKKLYRITNSKYDSIMATEIGEYAFYNCVTLSEFTLQPLGEIGKYAFYNTFLLYNVELYDASSIGEYAFYSSGISEANLQLYDSGVSVSAFENCKKLKSVDITFGRVESRAFWNSGIEELTISSGVEYIAEDAFAYSPIRNNDAIAEGDKYKSVYSLGIIEVETKKLIVGFTDSIKYSNADFSNAEVVEIGKYAFTGNDTLEKIIIPETVKKIDEYAFKDCYNLSEVYFVGNSVEFVGNDVFTLTNEGEIKDSELIIYVHKDSPIKSYLKENGLKYRHIEPDEIVVVDNKEKYTAFEQVKDIEVKLIYNEDEVREENVEQWKFKKLAFSNDMGYRIIYSGYGASSFSASDTYYTLEIYSSIGYELSKKVEVVVEKATPEYEIPTGLTATTGQTLADISLPDNFEWMNAEEKITEVGEKVFKAKYIPDDQENYLIVENINITLTVSKGEEEVVFEIKDYEYDETKNIITNIPVGISSEEYLEKFIYGDSYTIEFNLEGDYVNTGSKVKIYKDGSLFKELTNVVVGDTNGDGTLSVLDIVKINNHIVDTTKQLTDIFVLAGDYNKDGDLSVLDIVKINNVIVG